MNARYVLDGDPLWTDLKRLAREDLLFAPISGWPLLQARGARLFAVLRGEIPLPLPE